MFDAPFLNEVYEFAAFVHRGQLRKYTNEPYINHPVNVARLVQTVTHTDNMIAIALLHDVVEDTMDNTTVNDICDKFGDEFFKVWWLTNVDHRCGNRKRRKKLDQMRLSHAPADVQTIKCADIIDNCATIVKYDPNFAKVYLKEKLELLSVMQNADKTLWLKAYEIVLGGLL